MLISHRQKCLASFLFALSLVSFSFYLEYVSGFSPCLLCLVQRFFMVGILIVNALGCLIALNIRAKGLVTGFTVVFAILGLLAASRQVWLQHTVQLSGPVSCLPEASFLLAHFPLTDVIKMALTGTSECAEIGWTLAGFSLAEWSLVSFIIFLIVGLLPSRSKRSLG